MEEEEVEEVEEEEVEVVEEEGHLVTSLPATSTLMILCGIANLCAG